MKRNNRPVLAFGLLMAVVAFGAMPAVDAHRGTVGPTGSDTGQPIIDERPVIPGVSPQQAELIRFTQLDGNLSLLLRSPQDPASADVTTIGVTQRPLVDEHGVLPPRVVISQFPWHPSWDRARLTGARA